jgi:hypothetical protein
VCAADPAGDAWRAARDAADVPINVAAGLGFANAGGGGVGVGVVDFATTDVHPRELAVALDVEAPALWGRGAGALLAPRVRQDGAWVPRRLRKSASFPRLGGEATEEM